MNKLAHTWLLAISTVLLLTISQQAAADSRQQINESREVAKNEKIYIEVMSGEVRINAGKDNKFTVSGKLDEKAEGFELKSDNGFTHFEMKMPRHTNYKWGRDHLTADLDITVPVGSDIEFKGVNTNVTVSGINGGSKITTVNGDISASKLSNLVLLKTVNGAIKSDNNSGKVDLETVNGKIEDNKSSGRLNYNAVNGKVDASTSAEEVKLSIVNGDAKLTLRGTSSVQLSTVNGDINAQLSDSADPRISASSVSGDITLAVAHDINARFDISTAAGGSIKNNLTGDKPTKAKYGPSSSLRFSSGNGNGSVELNTVSGSLKLKKL